VGDVVNSIGSIRSIPKSGKDNVEAILQANRISRLSFEQLQPADAEQCNNCSAIFVCRRQAMKWEVRHYRDEKAGKFNVALELVGSDPKIVFDWYLPISEGEPALFSLLGQTHQICNMLNKVVTP
jgi:hypothetical protein